ncbi:MATE family efflux transporter [Candidatus Peregrinibacteria bacterium]|nr:MATE family efflux transporter [Candidatus Peregrinibacteria bacterium]
MLKERVAAFIRHPKKSLFILASPVIVGMIVQTLYNLVDTAYVGRLGAESIAALTFSFPIFFILIAINAGMAAGMGSRISRYLGENNKTAAENTAMHGLLISLILSFLLVFFGHLVLEPLFLLLGASGNVLKLAMDYTSIILMGVVFMLPGYILNSIFSAQGDTKTPMKIQISALIINIILDPIFIFGFGLGVKGAAIATVIAFTMALLIAIYYIKTVSHLHIHTSSYHFSPFIIRNIVTVGIPASMVMLLMSVYIMIINRFMAHFGTDYVASFGLASRLESVAVLPVAGLSMALLTLVGIFEGAKQYHLIKSISWFAIKISVLATSFVGLVFFGFPYIILRIFTSDPTLLSFGGAYLRIDVFTFPLMAVTMSISRIMQGMGYGFPGFMINLIRVFAVSIPLAYLFVFILGYSYLSVAVAMVLGSLTASVIAVSWLEIKLKKKSALKASS